VPEWPTSEHSILVDKSDNVWIIGAGEDDREALKFNSSGKLLLEIGHHSKAPKNNQDTSILGHPAGLFVDDAAHEIYIADGYLNNRVVVYNSDTGAFKRGWGAYGIPLSQVTNDIEGGDKNAGSVGTSRGPRPAPAAEPGSAGAKSVPPYSSKNGIIPLYKAGDPPDKQFRSPVHCAIVSNDRLVYVCDRHNNRIQVFTPEGKYIKEFYLRTATLGNGSTWYVMLSPDKAQKYMYVVDGENNHIWIMRRSDGAVVSSFGRSGRMAGQFHEVHSIAMDSKGNLYTGEVAGGERIQKFVLQQ
jgi:DNA-binding beta-propeller fold protein YncE